MATVTWRLFADLAETAGGREHTVSLDAAENVSDALSPLLEECDGLRERVFDGDELADDVNLMRNGSPASLSDPVADGDELALFPPVTGGSGVSPGPGTVDRR
ncbi:MAG: ubiquitin-like small modifier protein 1 [Haloquadratum sp.]